MIKYSQLYKLSRFTYTSIFIYSSIFIIIFQPSSHVLAKIDCDQQEFYRPYAYIRKKKNGEDIEKLQGQGFLDLRRRTRVILCINGP